VQIDKATEPYLDQRVVHPGVFIRPGLPEARGAEVDDIRVHLQDSRVQSYCRFRNRATQFLILILVAKVDARGCKATVRPNPRFTRRTASYDRPIRSIAPGRKLARRHRAVSER
jgi:hypothetical protein